MAEIVRDSYVGNLIQGVWHQTSNGAYWTVGMNTVERQKSGEYLYC